MSREVFKALDVYPWPVNIRELENLMERLAALHEGGTIAVDDLPDTMLNRASKIGPVLLNIPPDGADMEQVEKDLIREALERNRWDQTRVARLLRISRNTLIYYMQKYGLTEAGNR